MTCKGAELVLLAWLKDVEVLDLVLRLWDVLNCRQYRDYTVYGDLFGGFRYLVTMVVSLAAEVKAKYTYARRLKV